MATFFYSVLIVYRAKQFKRNRSPPVEGETTAQNDGVNFKDLRAWKFREIMELKRSTRSKKTAATKVRHNVKNCAFQTAI